MSEIFIKIKRNLKKVALFASLFLAVFFGLFYLVNFDFNSVKKSSSQTDITQDLNLNDEFKKRLGSTTFSLESYNDWTKRYGLNNSNNGLDADPDEDGLPNYLEYVHGTNPINSDTDGDKYTDKQEIDNGYDPDAALGNPQIKVEINITKLGLEGVPVIWSKTEIEKEMLSDLESGVSHYAQTAAPGQNGNAIISGHSSNYIWAKGNYNHIFKDLNNLEKGDGIAIKTIQKNGRVITYHYVVRGKYIDAPDDERIFETTETPILTLSTCWPLGTTFKRLVIKAELVK
jgi:LPXTG-site transpeptidase (sortase) family protein